MARPQKAGVDYFPLDVDLDDKLRYVIAKHGWFGFGGVVRLWQTIYGDNGYFMLWDDNRAILFAPECGAPVEDVRGLVSTCFDHRIFDRSLYEQYGILTSAGIQRRYVEITKKRVNRNFNPAYLLISLPSSGVSDAETRVSDAETGVSSVHYPQSKVKESKVKKSKEKESKENDSAGADTLSFDASISHKKRIGQVEYEALCNEYGKAAVDAKLDHMDSWAVEKNAQLRDPYKKLRSWLSEDARKEAPPGGYQGKKTSAHLVAQRQYSDDELNKLVETDLEKLLQEDQL